MTDVHSPDGTHDPVWPDQRLLAEVGWALARCIAEHPSASYRTAAAFIADCAAILEGRAAPSERADDAGVSDADVERCRALQADAAARGERPAPLGELLAHEGAVAFRPRAAQLAARTHGALHCAQCGTASNAWPPGPCPECQGVLEHESGAAVGEAFGRLLLVPAGLHARSATAAKRDLLPVIGWTMHAGARHLAVDCSPLGRFDPEHAVWIAEAVEMVLAEGGSLALIVPDARARQLLSTVGVDHYARVVETRLALAAARPDSPAQVSAPFELLTPGE